ncbi:hypothetical protein KDA11_05285, partial [Candidatus Saccharibacteria bacterium]|nr:hypothetical protein [Candidatus Saccharibacteria bacterium]
MDYVRAQELTGEKSVIYPVEILKQLNDAFELLKNYIVAHDEDLPRMRHYYFHAILDMRTLFVFRYMDAPEVPDYDAFWTECNRYLVELGEKIPQFNVAWEDEGFVERFYSKVCAIAGL